MQRYRVLLDLTSFAEIWSHSKTLTILIAKLSSAIPNTFSSYPTVFEHKWITIGVRLPKDFVANHAFYDDLFRPLRRTYTTNYDY